MKKILFILVLGLAFIVNACYIESDMVDYYPPQRSYYTYPYHYPNLGSLYYPNYYIYYNHYRPVHPRPQSPPPTHYNIPPRPQQPPHNPNNGQRPPRPSVTPRPSTPNPPSPSPNRTTPTRSSGSNYRHR